MLDGGCAQGAPGRAGFVRFHRSTNLRTATAFSFSSDEVAARARNLTMVTDSTTLFHVAPDASSETLLSNSFETFTSVSTLLLDLSEDLSGKHRDIALAIHQLSELGVLLTAKLLDREAPCSD